MYVPIALTLLMLCTAKVHCSQESPACPRKESYHGVLTLNVGSEVILGCRGDVTVDSVPLIMSTKHKERLKRRGDITRHWKSQKDRDGSGNTETLETPGKFNVKTTTSICAKSSEFLTTANPAMSSAKEKMGTGEILQTVNQSTKSISLSRFTEERGTFSIIMEMGLSTERSTSTEYEENEEYEKKVEQLRVTVKRQAQWTWNGQLKQDGVENGGVLRLPALQLTDSGNYSCYRRGKLISSVQITVGIPPESPTLSCYKKSHISKIRCEWISRQPIIPQPQCYLLLRKGLERISEVNCTYSAACSCCWCVLPSREDDRNVYTAKLCVTNAAGNATSSAYIYNPQNIIKPDPPDRVEVKPVKNEPHMLNVSWSLPATWMLDLYYTLYFQLRYRPIHAKEYQQVFTESRDWLITDALSYTDHEIQIRAKDEYEGQWSDWTSPVYAHTSTTPETTAVPDTDTSLEPGWLFPEGSGGSEVDVEIRPTANGVDVYMNMLKHVPLVVGVCLLITIIMISVYTLRYRMPFMSRKSKESVSSACSCSSPCPLLQQPLMFHKINPQEKEREGIHLHNVGYFFSPCGPARS